MTTRIRSALGMILGLSLVACAPPSKPADVKADATADAKTPKAEPEKRLDDNAAEPEGDPGSTEAPPFEAPTWFSPDVIAHKSVLQNGRSEIRPDGSYSAALLLELEDGETIPGCMEKLTGKISPDVEGLSEPTEGAEGRLEVRGDTDHYSLVAICGMGKGDKLTAYLSMSTKPG